MVKRNTTRAAVRRRDASGQMNCRVRIDRVHVGGACLRRDHAEEAETGAYFEHAVPRGDDRAQRLGVG